MVFISAGFDSRNDDTLGSFAITDECYAYLTRLVFEIAETFCNGRLVSLLEGLHNVDGTASTAIIHVGELVKDNGDTPLRRNIMTSRKPPLKKESAICRLGIVE